MGLIPEESFKYTHLDDRTRTIIWQRTSEIKELMRLTAENIISIGQKLTEVKEQLGHGSFQNWLRTEFEWSEQTARQFMQVYRWSEAIENKNFVFSQLATSALYLLAAPSTPPEAREEVLSLVNRGEKVTYTRAKSIVNGCKKLPLSIEEEQQERTIDITAQSEIILPSDSSSQQLFRLETSELGSIVRLYQADEIEKITDLNIGAVVKIKVGRWQGQTATIAEILWEQELVSSDNQQSDITVRTIEKADFSNQEKLSEMGQHLIICYGNTCLAVDGNPQILTAFTAQLQNNRTFVQEIFERALSKPEPEE